MASVAKCLVLAGAALEADALLLQTATTQCTQKGCSGNSNEKKDDVPDICEMYAAVEQLSADDKKKADNFKDGDKSSDTAKVSGKAYSCEKKECTIKEKKEQVDPAFVETTLLKDLDTKNAITKACDAAKNNAKDMCEAIAAVSGAGEGKVTKVEKGAAKGNVKITIEGSDPVEYKCKTTKKCDPKTGADGGEKVPEAKDVDTAGTGAKRTYAKKETVGDDAFAKACTA